MISTTERIHLIHRSLEIFVCGLVAIIPLIGFLPGLLAVVGAIRLARFHQEWNPASTYLKWGTVLALIGVVVSGLAGIALVFHLIESYVS